MVSAAADPQFTLWESQLENQNSRNPAHPKSHHITFAAAGNSTIVGPKASTDTFQILKLVLFSHCSKIILTFDTIHDSSTSHCKNLGSTLPPSPSLPAPHLLDSPSSLGNATLDGYSILR